MKQSERELMDEAYISVRKKNIFVAEADDPMRVRDSGVQQYLPQRLQKGPADIKVPVKQPAPVEQVPSSAISEEEYAKAVDMINELIGKLAAKNTAVKRVWDAVSELWGEYENQIMEKVIGD